MNKREMVECLINYYADGNKAQFARKLGLKPQTVSSWIDRDTFDVETIYAKCEGISAEWLLSGEGEMIKTKRNADINTDLLQLCKQVVTNYQQRDQIMSQLIGILHSLED